MKRQSLFALVPMAVVAALSVHVAVGQDLDPLIELQEDKAEAEETLPLIDSQEAAVTKPKLRTPRGSRRGTPFLAPAKKATEVPFETDFPPMLDSPENIASDPVSRKPSRSSLVEIFEGDFTSMLPADLPQGPIRIAMRSYQVEKSQAGETRRIPIVTQQTVDPRSPDLSPEQRLGVFVAINESAIHEKQHTLFQADDSKVKDKLLSELRELYSTRFEIDTAYQDFKVREIERRAQKLRAEVNARETASEDWVQAMVTLAKMRADGIQTMDSLPNLPQASGYGDRSFLDKKIQDNYQSRNTFKESYDPVDRDPQPGYSDSRIRPNEFRIVPPPELKPRATPSLPSESFNRPR